MKKTIQKITIVSLILACFCSSGFVGSSATQDINSLYPVSPIDSDYTMDPVLLQSHLITNEEAKALFKENYDCNDDSNNEGNLRASCDKTSCFPTPVSQSGGDCTAYAIGYYMKSGSERKKYGWSINANCHKFSPKYLFDKANTAGVLFGWDAVDYVVTDGICSINYYPLNTAATLSAGRLSEAASLHKSATYFVCDSISTIKTMLNNSLGVVIEINVYNDFDTISSSNQVYNQIGANEEPRGRHAICLVGYDDSKSGGAFKFVNSWGTNWGLNGYGWISYAFVNSTLINLLGAGYGYALIEQQKDLDTFLMGDANNNGSITSADASLVLQFAAHTATPTNYQFAISDVNGDAKVNSTDATLISKYAAHLISQFPLYD